MPGEFLPVLIGSGRAKLPAHAPVPPRLTCGPSLSLVQVAQTADGVDADLWKDGLFKSKVTRYLCFTRSFSKENVSLVVLFRLLSGHRPLTFLFEMSMPATPCGLRQSLD